MAMDIVVMQRDWITISPNERYTVPDEIGQQLIDRGRAEKIEPAIIEHEEKHKIKRGSK